MAAAKRFSSQTRVVLPGSEKAAYVPGEAAQPGTVQAAGTRKRGGGVFTVSVIVRPKEAIKTKTLGKPGSRMTRAEFAKKHGPDPAAVRMVKAFAKEFGLTVEGPAKGGARTLSLSGTQAAMETAFGVTLQQQEIGGMMCRLREGGITLPEEMAGSVVAVLGLDTRPQATAKFRVAKATNVSYTPPQVAELYGFPSGASAAGQTIGLIELGGGFRAADITAYFKTLKLTAPTVTAVSVDKGKNSPSTASGADGEVMLDIEVSASVALGAKIAVYFAPNTDQGFIDAVTQAVHDTTNKPSVISISWGGPESTWTKQSLTALDAACQAAAVLGVTITVAAGDDGSTDGVTDGATHVDFPASSPHVLGCGGTKLTGSGKTIASEVVWNELAANEGATGGGVSNSFALPTWQTSAKVPAPTVSGGGRGVPDVSGDADPATGYSVRVDGQTLVIGGTSAVAPLWAGLIALANAANKTTAGFINPTIYAAAAKTAFRDITSGNNGAFSAGPGWDACAGLGSPMGAAVIKALAPKASTTKKGGKSTATGAQKPAVKAPKKKATG
jgi:kumamolisin